MKNSAGINNFSVHRNDTLIANKNQLINNAEEVGVFSGADLFRRNILELPKMLGELLPKVGLVLLAGSSDTGKSIFARDLILSLVLNKSQFIGFPFSEQLSRKAIIVCTEDDDLAISYLIRKQLKNQPEDLIIRSLENLYFIFDADNLIGKLEDILVCHQIDIIKIDTLGDLVTDIKDNGEVRHVLSCMKRLATTYQCLILLMHHTNKRTESLIPNKSNVQGAGGLEQKCRLVLELRNDMFDGNLKHLSVLKGNYLGLEYKGSSFVLECDPLTLTFSNTGRRVLFDDLIHSRDSQVSESKKVLQNYDAIDKDLLKAILKSIFMKFGNGLLRSQLKPLLAEGLKNSFDLDQSPGLNKVSDLITRLQIDKILSNPEEESLRGKAAIINLNPDTELN